MNSTKLHLLQSLIYQIHSLHCGVTVVSCIHSVVLGNIHRVTRKVKVKGSDGSACGSMAHGKIARTSCDEFSS